MSNKNGWITDRVPDSNRAVLVNFGEYMGHGRWFSKSKCWKCEVIEREKFIWEWSLKNVLGWQDFCEPEESGPVDWKEVPKMVKRTTKVAITKSYVFRLSEKAWSKIEERKGYCLLGNMPCRTDPDLIAVIEELGTKAWGKNSEIKVVEIPYDVDWEITELDRGEYVEEIHRFWR